MAHGGRRAGSGRPPKRVIHASPIRAAEQKIADRLPWLVDKLIELADGVYEEKTVGDGVVIVYKERPDRQSAEYLIDRVLGKAVARSENGSPGDFEVDLDEQERQRLRSALKVVRGRRSA